MQREIKFRAWDVDRKKMVSAEKMKQLFLKVQYLLELKQEFMCEDGLYIPFKKDIYMQFTGLHDKNGIEIYEGDILKWGDSTAKIEWNKNGYVFADEPMLDYCTFLNPCSNHNYEVIGNIYENPNLLDQEDNQDE